MEVFDVAGRRIATITPAASRGALQWGWDGRDGSGRPLGPGVVFARVRGDARLAVRVIIAP